MRARFTPISPLRDVVRALFRFPGRALLWFFATMVAVTAALVFAEREYQSEARLFVRWGRENAAPDPTATTGPMVSRPETSREAEINSAVEVLQSRYLVERALEIVGPERPLTTPKDREKALRSMQRHLRVWTPRASTVIGITYEASSPERAQKIVSALVSTYLDEHMKMNRAPGSYDFFSEQARLLKQQLEDKSAALRDAKNEQGLMTMQSQQMVIQEHLTALKKLMLETEAELEATTTKLQALRQGLDDLPESLLQQILGGSPTHAAASMRDRLYELQMREQELLSKYTEEHPVVTALREQVRQAERIYELERPALDQSRHAVLLEEQSKATSLQAKLDSLVKQQDELDNELQEANRQEVRINQLQREVRLLETNYLSYSEKLEQSRIDQALKGDRISNISVIQPASLEPKPVRPNKALILILGLMVATAGAVAVAFLSHILDPTLRSALEAEWRLQIPVLASVPAVRGTLSRSSSIKINGHVSRVET